MCDAFPKGTALSFFPSPHAIITFMSVQDGLIIAILLGLLGIFFSIRASVRSLQISRSQSSWPERRRWVSAAWRFFGLAILLLLMIVSCVYMLATGNIPHLVIPATPTITLEPTATNTPSATPTTAPSSTFTPVQTDTPTITFTPSLTITISGIQTWTPLPSDTHWPTWTPSRTATSTSTRLPTGSPTVTSTYTSTRTPLPTDTRWPTHSPTSTKGIP
jgi:hypothetical protein